MANMQDIKKVILDVAGNPESGVVAEYAEKWAIAIASLDSDTPYNPEAKDGDRDGMVQDGTPFERPAKETRVTKPTEKR
jgi:hypothetical protein